MAPLSQPARTLSEEAYARLRADVLAGRLKPGDKLRFRQLNLRYSLGTAPLREALSRLASERLVLFHGQKGFAVAPVSLEELAELCDLRIDLTNKALRRAIERGGVDWESEILAALHTLEHSPRPTSDDGDLSPDEWEMRHDRFHRSLIVACGSRWLLDFCQELSDQFQRYRRVNIITISGSERLWDEIRDQHRMIAEATIARDVETATTLLARHFQGSLDKVMQANRLAAQGAAISSS